MNKKIQWITTTALMLALLISLQALTKSFGQFVTGSCVNMVLVVSALIGGLGCGLAVALISPVAAFLLGIAPQILTVPAIMAGNAVFVVLLSFTRDKGLAQRVTTWLAAAVCKFLVLYAIVVGLICGVFSQTLLSSGALKAPMLQVLSATFSWPQLITALVGGGVALLLVPALRKAIHK